MSNQHQADPGEVERLRAGIRKHWRVVCNQRSRIIELRDQLAERDALLRDTLAFMEATNVCYPMPYELRERMRAALSASAEPSAPSVDDCGNWSEQDFKQLDRKAFEASLPVPAYVYWDDKHSRYLTNCNHSACSAYQGSFEGWQARAALERPTSNRRLHENTNARP